MRGCLSSVKPVALTLVVLGSAWCAEVSAGQPLKELEQPLIGACDHPQVSSVFKRDDKADRADCVRSVGELIAALSDKGECRWADVNPTGIGNDACVNQVRDGMHVPPGRVAILWTGQRAKLTALTASQAPGAKYISLEATQWGAILDKTNELPAWDNRSQHWAVLSAVFTEKTDESSEDVPILAGISFPRAGAFVESEVPRIVGTKRNEFIVVDLYGRSICDLEKMERNRDFCARSHFGGEKRRRCELESNMIDCETSCATFLDRFIVGADRTIGGFDCKAEEMGAGQGQDQSVFFCANGPAAEGARDTAAYLRRVTESKTFAYTCLEKADD